MGMARPLPILSALHSGTFLSRSGSAPFRDWKRRDTGALGLGTGGRNARSPVPQQAPDLTTLLSPGPALPAHSPHPAPLGTLGTLQPSPPASSPLLSSPPTASRAVLLLAERGYVGPPPVGHTGPWRQTEMAWDAGGAWMEAKEAQAVKELNTSTNPTDLFW